MAEKHAALMALSDQTVTCLQARLDGISEYRVANRLLIDMCGIERFFANTEEWQQFRRGLYDETRREYHAQTRREYGDFQTPFVLTDAVCAHLRVQNRQPEVLVEPTCGTGTFLLSALQQFPSLQVVHGVEIYAPYYWKTKGRILEWAITHPGAAHPRIVLTCDDVFSHDFQGLLADIGNREILVIGNPPWVTNAELGKRHSDNVPQKRNIKALQGLDALTGKSNFDISETILRVMLDTFAKRRGSLAMLAKQAVIKQVVQELPTFPYTLKNLRASRIDTRKFFRASVEASLFEATFQATIPACTCRVGAFGETSGHMQTFGWVGERFVADTQTYRQVADFDSVSSYEWRQGLKHDCAPVMELQRGDVGFVNGLGERIDIEPDVVYGLLKSSDLQAPVVGTPRKYVLVTQRALGEDTAYLAGQYPRTFAYLSRHCNRFERRKSRIYKGKPLFSIFGIGTYAFAPYKVAISGLYKRANFALILPGEGERPVMLDDTCYFLGFDTFYDAVWVWALLQSDTTRLLLQSIVFAEDKRPYSKQRLMRIGIDRLALTMSYEEILSIIQRLDKQIAGQVSVSQWQAFVEQFSAM